jgi:hypothetical protein
MEILNKVFSLEGGVIAMVGVCILALAKMQYEVYRKR